MSDDLRCDCDPDARPRAIEQWVGKIMQSVWLVRCEWCLLKGNSGDTKAEAIKRWQKGERFSE